MINPEYAKAVMYVAIKQQSYKSGGQLPLIARNFIEMGAKNGIDICVEYGYFHDWDEGSIRIGYWIKAPQKNKQIFLPDIKIETETDQNIKSAMDFMEKSVQYLKTLP